MARMTKTERSARDQLMRDLIYLQQENWIPDTVAEAIPDAWHTLDWDTDVVEKTQKITLYLDASVVKFFRAMGKGWHKRVNRLLATYVQMHLAKEMRLEEALRERVGMGAPSKDTPASDGREEA